MGVDFVLEICDCRGEKYSVIMLVGKPIMRLWMKKTCTVFPCRKNLEKARKRDSP
jgi:hypothetical protein